MQPSCNFKANQQNPHTNTTASASYKATAVELPRRVLRLQLGSCYLWGLRKDTFLQEGNIYGCAAASASLAQTAFERQFREGMACLSGFARYTLVTPSNL